MTIRRPRPCARPASAARTLVLVTLAFTLCGCSPKPQATSLLGEPLYPRAFDGDALREREEELAEARTAWKADPDDEIAIIWYGRRLAYLERYDEAIDVFTRGLEIHSDSYRLLRHRGHRYISTRRLEEAVADLERAASLAAGVVNAVEPDGLPNARGLPRSTTHGNIYYHLALARYLQGRYSQAANAWQRCVELAENDDADVAARYWLYHSRRRAGEAERAAEVLEPVTDGMDVIENHAYYEALRLYRGELEPNEVLGSDGDVDVQSATVAYGIAMWYEAQDRPDERRAILESILEGKGWAAFGYIAAEADIARERAAADEGE